MHWRHITHTSLFKQFTLLWHLLLHKTLFLKQAHRLLRHLLGPLQLHLTKPRPPCWDSFLLAWRSDTLLSLLMSDSLRSRWGHKSNWCRLYFPFRIPEGQPMVYCPFSTANITPEIFLGSPRPLSTDGMGTATLSPTVQSFIITRLRLTTRSSCFCCAAIESFFSCLCCSLVEAFLVEVELFLIEVELFLVEVESLSRFW